MTKTLTNIVNPVVWYKAFRQWNANRKVQDVQRFAHNHKKYLVIVCDPADDTLFMSYRDQQIFAQIKTVDGKKRNVVKGVLKHSTFNVNIDMFLTAMVENLKVKLTVPEMNHFIQFLDGGLFQISKKLKLIKDSKKEKQL